MLVDQDLACLEDESCGNKDVEMHRAYWDQKRRYQRQGMSAFVVGKIRDVMLRWFRHVKRSCTDAPLRRFERLAIVDSKER